MSDKKPVSLKEQVRLMRKELAQRETSYPIRVEMSRMTKKEMTDGLAWANAVLETLQRAEASGGVAESALKEMAPAAKSDTADLPDLPDLTIVMNEVHRCAREHAGSCEHCAAIANILDEVGSKA